MPIPVTCPNCRKRMNAPDRVAGRKVSCPGCGAVLVIPVPVAAVADPPPRHSAQPPHQHVSVNVGGGGRRANGLGVAALVSGVVGCVICWIPFCGLISWPFAGLAILLGGIGLIVAAADGSSGFGTAIGGLVTGVLAVVLSLIATAVFSAAIGEATRDAARARSRAPGAGAARNAAPVPYPTPAAPAPDGR